MDRAARIVAHLSPEQTAGKAPSSSAAALAGGAAAAGAGGKADDASKPGSLALIEKVLSQHRSAIDGVLAKWLPRKFDNANMEFICGKARYAYDTESMTKGVAEPIWNILDRGGKRWRPTLLILVAEALGAKLESVLDFIAVCELVHNGSLVVDDIEDGSQLRRGLPCLHRVYPLDVAVNAGNAMYFLPLVVLRKKHEAGELSNATLVKVYEIYAQEMINLHVGQGLDIWWHNGKKEPSIAEYLQMCAYKTGTLARMSAKISAVVAGANGKQVDAFGRFAEAIGVAFQIQDDLLNIAGEKFVGHETGEDIHEGKRTLMVIHSLQHGAPADSRRLNEILAMHTTEEPLIKEAIALLRKTNSLAFAQQKAREIISNAWQDIAPHLKNSEAKNKLKAFADYLVEREF